MDFALTFDLKAKILLIHFLPSFIHSFNHHMFTEGPPRAWHPLWSSLSHWKVFPASCSALASVYCSAAPDSRGVKEAGLCEPRGGGGDPPLEALFLPLPLSPPSPQSSVTQSQVT